MEHDIQGAKNGGVDSLFVASGIHHMDVLESPIPIFSSVGVLGIGALMLHSRGLKLSFGTFTAAGMIVLAVAKAAFHLDLKAFGRRINLHSLQNAAKKFGAYPTYVIENFQW